MYCLRYILPAVATARLAFAAGCSGTTTIQNSGDASALASCQTYTGTIAIATTAADEVRIDDLQAIDGDLIVKNAKELGSIGADSLTSISGKFTLISALQLTSLDFPELSEVDEIEWRTLPQLNGLSFDAGIQKASVVSILDTQLQDLSGLTFTEADEITIQSNGILSNVSFALETIKTGLTLSANGADMTLSLPSLTDAKSLILQDLGSIDIPELKKVGGVLAVESGSFESFDAPKITEVGSTLTIQDNSQLSEISMEQLKTVDGGFVIAGNPALSTIGGLPKLETISGNLDFTGDFDDVELPKLTSVKGAFNMQSRGDIKAVCDKYDKLHGKNLPIRGKYTCTPKDDDVTKIGGGDDGGNGASDSGDFGISLNIPMGTVLGLTGVLTAVLGML